MRPTQYTSLSNSTGVLTINEKGRIVSVSGDWLSHYKGDCWGRLIGISDKDKDIDDIDSLMALAEQTSSKMALVQLRGLGSIMLRCSKELLGFSVTVVKPEVRATYGSLKDAISTFAKSHSRVALLLIDCEGVLSLNSAVGYETTDLELFKVSDALQQVVANYEDALLLTITPGHYALMSESITELEIADIYEKMKKSVKKSTEHGIQLNASCAITTTEKLDLDSYLISLESLLEIAKQSRSNRLEMAVVNPGRPVRSLRSELEDAIESSQFTIFYQPILSLADMKIASVEALARWNHPTRGLVGPIEFIDKLQKYRLMDKFGKFLVNQVISDIQRWDRDDIKVSINVSPAQLSSTDFVSFLVNQCSANSINPKILQIEVTEDSAYSDTVGRSVERLRGYGFDVVIDDFGTGYSNIVNLRSMALSAIKIDKSLLFDESQHISNRKGFFTQVVHLCKSISNAVVIEGIESKQHERLAIESGATYVQGFLYAHPATSEELECSKLWRR